MPSLSCLKHSLTKYFLAITIPAAAIWTTSTSAEQRSPASRFILDQITCLMRAISCHLRSSQLCGRESIPKPPDHACLVCFGAADHRERTLNGSMRLSRSSGLHSTTSRCILMVSVKARPARLTPDERLLTNPSLPGPPLTASQAIHLRRIPASLPWSTYAIAVVEFGEPVQARGQSSPPAERASFYGVVNAST